MAGAIVAFIVCWHLYLSAAHKSPEPPPLLIDDNFPLGLANKVPSIPVWNASPTPHVVEQTPLFIGFTQNWLLLQQTVVSYLTAGWPASDIIVVDNTGTMLSNQNSQLTIQNPSYLDYHRLRDVLGVKVISTPSQLSFSQLQNFYLYESIQRNWTHYFWSHMDVAILSSDSFLSDTYESFYTRVVLDLRQGLSSTDWAVRFYLYDRLALVSVAAYTAVGGWDTSIPYYPTDCDMYERLNMAGYKNPSPDVGYIFDVASSIKDLSSFYQVGMPKSPSYQELYGILKELEMHKNQEDGERNTWQDLQQGGQGEPYYRDVKGSMYAKEKMIEAGRKIYRRKWGTSECRLYEAGVRLSDAWAPGFRWGVLQWF